jgi:hypothetical protein
VVPRERAPEDALTHSDTPFPYWVIDRWCRPVSYEALPGIFWEEWEVGYSNDCERGKRTTRTIPDGFEKVFGRLRSPDTVARWAGLTGIPDLVDDPNMHGGGLHVMPAGGWLQGHVDYARHPKLPDMERRLNLIAFLHPEWRPAWGGRLLLMDAVGRTVAAIDPLPGRLVAFETGDTSYHGVQRVAADAPPRVSAAVYYLAPLRPNVVRQRALFFPNRNAPHCPSEVA